jgi:hypothetical protein
MITFEEIAQKYDGKSITTIETMIKTSADKHSYHRKEFILALFYLERTNKYKENKTYKDETFKRYISDMFNLSYSGYNKERFAFITVPEAAEKYGVGVIDRIASSCGSHKVTDVVKQIDTKKSVKRAEINKIIEKNAKPKPAPKPRFKPIIIAAPEPQPLPVEDVPPVPKVKTLPEKQKDDQIEKLKKTVVDHKETIEIMSLEMSDLKKENYILKQENEKLRKENLDLKKRTSYPSIPGFPPMPKLPNFNKHLQEHA